MKQRKTIYFFVFWCLFLSLYTLHGYRFYDNSLRAEAPGIASKGFITLGSSRSFTELNPLKTPTNEQDNILDLLFNTLVKVDRSGNVTAGLAETWKVSADMKDWTFNVRKDVFFHDGFQLTAKDVLFTFETLLKFPEQNQDAVFSKNIKSINLEGDFAVTFHLRDADQTFLFLLSLVLIVPSHHFNIDGSPKDATYYRYPIGSGPFKIKSFSADEIQLEANQVYFLGRPLVGGVIYKNFKSERGVFSALIHREMDVMAVPTSNFVYSKVVRNIPYLSSGLHFTAALFLFFNQSDPNLKDVEVRRALNYLVDRERLLRDVLRTDDLTLTSSLVPPKSRLVNSDLKTYPYDPDRAIELFKKSGWIRNGDTGLLMKNGQPFSFEVVALNDVEMVEKVLEFLSLEFRHAGIQMNVKLVNLDEIPHLFYNKKSVSSFFYYHSDTTGIYGDWLMWKNNYFGKSDQQSQVDRLLDQARFTDNANESLKAYREFQKIAHDDPPVLYLFWQDFPIFYNTRLSGLETDQWLTYRDFHKVWINQ